MKKRLIINTVLYTILPKLPAVAGILILPFITPYLTLEDYGKFGLVLAYYSAFSMFVTLGQDVVLQNSFFEYKGHFRKIWNRSFGIMIVGASLISIILAIAFFFILGGQLDAEYFTVSIMFAIALILTPIATIAQVFYVMKEQPYPLALRSVIMGFLNAIIVLVAIKYFKLGYLGWVIGFAANGIISLLFFIYPICIRNKIVPYFRYKKKHTKEYLKVGLPLLPHQLAVYIFNTSSRVLLDFFGVNVRAIGLYSQGYNLGSNGMVYLNGLFTALSRTLQQALRDKTVENRRLLQKIFFVIVAGNSILFFNCSLWMKEIYLFLFRNPELQSGYHVALLILMGYSFFPLYDFAMYPLFVTKKTNLVAKISIFAAIFSILTNVIFIPKFGYLAALYVTYISFAILSLGGLFHQDTRQELSWIFSSPVKVYIIAICWGLLLTLIVWYLMDISFFYKFTTSLLSIILLIIGLLFAGLITLPKLGIRK